MLDAAARRAAVGCRRSSRQSNGRRPRCRLHGPHPSLPGPGREAQGVTRRLGRVQLSEGDRLVQLWSVFQ